MQLTVREKRILEFALNFLTSNLDDGEVEALTDVEIYELDLENSRPYYESVLAEIHALEQKIMVSPGV
jgi:hypothetical protein